MNKLYDIKSAEVDKYTKDQRLKFYTDYFEELKCVRCNHYVSDDWVIYDGELYDSDCYDNKLSEDKTAAIKKIREYEFGINTLENRFGLNRAILDED